MQTVNRSASLKLFGPPTNHIKSYRSYQFNYLFNTNYKYFGTVKILNYLKQACNVFFKYYIEKFFRVPSIHATQIPMQNEHINHFGNQFIPNLLFLVSTIRTEAATLIADIKHKQTLCSRNGDTWTCVAFKLDNPMSHKLAKNNRINNTDLRL